MSTATRGVFRIGSWGYSSTRCVTGPDAIAIYCRLLGMQKGGRSGGEVCGCDKNMMIGKHFREAFVPAERREIKGEDRQREEKKES